MAHIGASDEDWANAKVGGVEEENCYHCNSCAIDFSIEGPKIRGRDVHCPMCLRMLKSHFKGWTPPRF